jgi:hypothetical protein
VALGLVLERLVQPLRVVLDTRMAIAIPPSLKVSVVTVAIPIVVGFVVFRIPVAPALGLLNTLPLGFGRSIRAAASRVLPEPGF